MDLKDILIPELTRANCLQDSSKKQLFEFISRMISEHDQHIKHSDVLETLLQRERLGSTAIGHGIAIPHARLKNLKAPVCVLTTLKNALNYDAEECTAVDIIFALLVPKDATQEHLALLANIANAIRNKRFREQLRLAKTDEELYNIATSHHFSSNNNPIEQPE